MKQKLTRFWTLFLSSLPSLLGFGGCRTLIGGGGGMVCLYGVPTADYDYELTLKDEEGNPIEGIQVTSTRTENTSLTDSKGKVEGSISCFPHRVEFTIEDIDGEANGGEFLPDTVRYEDFSSKRIKSGDRSFYEGEYEIKAEKTLKKAK